MTITINNLEPYQERAIEILMAKWQQLGELGSSRWTAFYADGDGEFRPRIEVDGRSANSTTKEQKTAGEWVDYEDDELFAGWRIDPDELLQEGDNG